MNPLEERRAARGIGPLTLARFTAARAAQQHTASSYSWRLVLSPSLLRGRQRMRQWGLTARRGYSFEHEAHDWPILPQLLKGLCARDFSNERGGLVGSELVT